MDSPPPARPTSVRSDKSFRKLRKNRDSLEEPYLTHVVKNLSLGQLTPPQNMGRIRKPRSRSRGRKPIYDEPEAGSPPNLNSQRREPTSRPISPAPSAASGGPALPHPRPPPIPPRLKKKKKPPATKGLNGHNGHLTIPDFPPPSFEEAVSQPGPSRITSGPYLNTSLRSPSVLSLSSSNGSEGSGLEVDADVPLDKPVSAWEKDLKAGFSLEERVKREWERRHAEVINTPILLPDPPWKTSSGVEASFISVEPTGSPASDHSLVKVSPNSKDSHEGSDWELLNDSRSSGQAQTLHWEEAHCKDLPAVPAVPEISLTATKSDTHSSSQIDPIPKEFQPNSAEAAAAKLSIHPTSNSAHLNTDIDPFLTIREPVLERSTTLLKVFDPFYSSVSTTSGPGAEPTTCARPLPAPPTNMQQNHAVETAFDAIRRQHRPDTIRGNEERDPNIDTLHTNVGSGSHRECRSTFGELTELDVLVSRLQDDRTGRGDNYEELLLVEEVLGEAKSTAASGQTLEDISVGRVETIRRRVTKEGRVKVKLSLFGVNIDNCGVCLAQFKAGNMAALLPKCQHCFHEKCLRSWILRSHTCPNCRLALN